MNFFKQIKACFNNFEPSRPDNNMKLSPWET